MVGCFETHLARYNVEFMVAFGKVLIVACPLLYVVFPFHQPYLNNHSLISDLNYMI